MEWEKQGNAFTSVKSPFASSSGQAGRPPTSIQLLNTSMSSSSLVASLAPSSSSDSPEGESYKKAVQTGINMDLLSKVIKKEEIVSYLCYSHQAPLPPAPPPSLL